MSYIIVKKCDVDGVNPKIDGDYVVFNSFQGDDNNLKLKIVHVLCNGESLALDVVSSDTFFAFKNFVYHSIDFQYIA